MPFSTTPNLADYVAFLLGVVGIPATQFPTVNGTASGGTTLSITDSTQSWTANQWVGYSLTDVTQGAEFSYIVANDATTLTLNTSYPLGVAPVAGDAYLIAPAIAADTFSVAVDIVNDALSQAPGTLYALAVYNLGADRLLNYAVDAPGQTYFQDLRVSMKLMAVSVGVASSSNDQGTSVGILNPDALRDLTMMDLQTLKTPYGRAYMGFAQQYGPSLWGLT
jgi:hypothetical protein